MSLDAIRERQLAQHGWRNVIAFKGEREQPTTMQRLGRRVYLDVASSKTGNQYSED